MNDQRSAIEKAVQTLQAGGVIAYPTEAVFGLGCDPECQAAVEKISQLKGREASQAYILVASDWSQVQAWVDLPDPTLLEKPMRLWPGPVTWVFPASQACPRWVSGGHQGSVAIRISAHPIVQALCQAWGGPLVSTSANPHGKLPAKSADTVQAYFSQAVDFIVEGTCGTLAKPTPIYDGVTQQQLR